MASTIERGIHPLDSKVGDTTDKSTPSLSSRKDFFRQVYDWLSSWLVMITDKTKLRGLLCNPSLAWMLVAAFIPTVSASADFKQCLAEVQQGLWGNEGGTDNRGQPVANISQATAITYNLCVKACGTDSEAFSWSSFSQQFGAWLLPWLALVSNLPFGASIRHDNVMSVFLVVGSPTLAAYSIALTVLNGQWIAMRFRGLRYPNAERAVQVLRNLQQVPLKIITDDCLLYSLVVLPENNHWWDDIAERLDYTYTWSISSATSIAWVFIAYLFTLIDSFTNIDNNFNSSGQGVGSAWLWLLPVVAGWLLLSPKSDYNRVYRAVRRANKNAYVQTPTGIVKASKRSQKFAFSLQRCHDSSVFRANESSPPVFNYARFLPWVQAVEEVHSAFEAAARKAHNHLPVDPSRAWVGSADYGIDRANRIGSLTQIQRYCTPSRGKRRGDLWKKVYPRIFVAGLIGVGVQWGTTGAAVIVQYFTPTRGIGCRSAAYLLYASISTIIWGILVVSSILAHYSTLGDRLSVEDSFVMQTYSPTDDRSPNSEFVPLPEASPGNSSYGFPSLPQEPFIRPGTGASQTDSYMSGKGKYPEDFATQGGLNTPSTSNTRVGDQFSPTSPRTIGSSPTTPGSLTIRPEHSRYPSNPEKSLLLWDQPPPTINPIQNVDDTEELDDPLPAPARLAARVSVVLRRLAYLLAILNSIWLVCTCLFQLCNFLSRCYCDSSYLGLRSKAYAVFTPNADDIAIMKKAWLAGVGLGTSSCAVFFGFIWLYINPPHAQLD